jgi:hypothetical protein
MARAFLLVRQMLEEHVISKPMDAEKALADLKTLLCPRYPKDCNTEQCTKRFAAVDTLARAAFEEADATWPERHDSRNPKPPPKWLTETSR